MALLSISELPPSTNAIGYSSGSVLPAIITKFDGQGNLLWQKELPEIVQTAWHAVLLANGNIAVTGLGKDADSKFIGIVVLNEDGEVSGQNTLFNPGNLIFALNGGFIGSDIIQLNNGNIALTTTMAEANTVMRPRLVIYDFLLNKIYDELYEANSVVIRRNCAQVNLLEDAQGDIIIHGRDLGFNNDSLKYFAFDLKVQSGTYAPIYHQIFEEATLVSPSSFALSTTGSSVWAAAGPLAKDTVYSTWFNFRYQEVYRIGPSATVWQANGNAAQTQTAKIQGYPKNGYLSKVKRCADGGYILLGTCNINTNQAVPSEYQIMLVKISASLSVQWMQFPNTITPTIASDIVETSTGFLVSGTQLSFGEMSRPILFKTDNLGNLN
jgi:hypothetical protein